MLFGLYLDDYQNAFNSGFQGPHDRGRERLRFQGDTVEQNPDEDYYSALQKGPILRNFCLLEVKSVNLDWEFF